VRSGSSYDSQSDMRVHFGLGVATKIESIEIRWPNGKSESFGGLKTDAINTLTEGTGVALGSEATPTGLLMHSQSQK